MPLARDASRNIFRFLSDENDNRNRLHKIVHNRPAMPKIIWINFENEKESERFSRIYLVFFVQSIIQIIMPRRDGG